MQDWFKKWFSSDDYLLVYDHRDEKDALDLNALILKETNLSPGAGILDAACGAGRHSILFARAGFNVTGFDLSENLLNKAREKAFEERLIVNFINADMRSFKPTANYDLITNLFTSFGYFENDDDNFAFVKNSYPALKESGFYVLDYLNSNYIHDNLVSDSERTINGVQIKEKRVIESDRVNKEIVISREEEQNIFRESVKLYSFEELIENFEKLGYKFVKVFGNYQGEPFDSATSPRVVAFFGK